MTDHPSPSNFLPNPSTDRVDEHAVSLPLLKTIQNGVGILPRPQWECLLVQGADASSFLNGLTTNHIEAIALGAVQPNLLCGGRGKILHQLLIARIRTDAFLLMTLPEEAQPVAAYLNGYLIRERAQIGMAGLQRCDLIGPRAAEWLQAANQDPYTPLTTFEGQPALILRHALGRLPHFITWTPAATTKQWQAALGKMLLPPQDISAPANLPAMWIDEAAFEQTRIQLKIPRMYQDFTQNHQPGEVGLEQWISWQKGCYIGQEPHARARYRGQFNQKLMAITLPQHAPATCGASLFLADEETETTSAVGHITSLSQAHWLEQDGEPKKPGAGETGSESPLRHERHGRYGIAMMRVKALQNHTSVRLAPPQGNEGQSDSILARLQPLYGESEAE